MPIVIKDGKMYDLEPYNNEALQQFLAGEISAKYVGEYVSPVVPKSAEDYLAFAQSFFVHFSNDCIAAGNSIAVNDSLQAHLGDVFVALQLGRLDKAYTLLNAKEPLPPFFTLEIQQKYLQMIAQFIAS